jgi:tRNA 2-selenouridine synthase
VPITKKSIRDFLQDASQNVLLDVRSPSEFLHAHIPGALNLPLFSDEERKQVGTTYKQVSRESAIKLGLEFFGPKMKDLVETAELLTSQKNTPAQADSLNPALSVEEKKKPVISIYCWRGGMRSAAVAWLLDLYGFRVSLLSGGYKSFRNLAIKSFEFPYPFRILGGYTGSGKTFVLHQLEKEGETVIDLELIATHKGSAFGNIDMKKQPSQEMFENILATQLIRISGFPGEEKEQQPTIWLEDESQRIGNLNIPMSVWNNMRNAPVFFLDIGFEQRLDNICEEYGPLDVERLKESTQRISKRLGPLDTKNVIGYLDEGNIKQAFSILLKYYDKSYKKGLHNRKDLENLLTILPCEEVDPNNARRLLTIYQPL